MRKGKAWNLLLCGQDVQLWNAGGMEWKMGQSMRRRHRRFIGQSMESYQGLAKFQTRRRRPCQQVLSTAAQPHTSWARRSCAEAKQPARPSLLLPLLFCRTRSRRSSSRVRINLLHEAETLASHIKDTITSLQERPAEDIKRQVASRLDAAESVPVAHVGETEVLFLDREELAADVDFDVRQLRRRKGGGKDVALHAKSAHGTDDKGDRGARGVLTPTLSSYCAPGIWA